MRGNPGEASIVASLLHDWVFDESNGELFAESIKAAIREYRSKHKNIVDWRNNETKAPEASPKTANPETVNPETANPSLGATIVRTTASLFYSGAQVVDSAFRDGATAFSKAMVVDRSTMFSENLDEINGNNALDYFFMLKNPEYGGWFSTSERSGRASLNTLIMVHIYRRLYDASANHWRKLTSDPLKTPEQALLIYTAILGIRNSLLVSKERAPQTRPASRLES